MPSSHLQHKPTIVLTNPVTGMSLRILTSAAESGGSLLGMEAFYPAGLGSAAALRTPRQSAYAPAQSEGNHGGLHLGELP